MKQTTHRLAIPLFTALALGIAFTDSSAFAQPTNPPEIRTPKAPATPRINGAAIFGVRPGHPFFYQIPATGDRPMEFSVDRLPGSLKVDAKTGLITGSMPEKGEHTITLQAKNAKGKAKKTFKIVVG